MNLIPSQRPLTVLAWVNVIVHITGLVFAVVGMRPGSPLVPLPERLAYLAQAPLGWSLGWGAWMLCALALIAFFAALAGRLVKHTEMAHLAVLLASAGGAVDLLCDVIDITVLPALASQGPAAETAFLACERIAFGGGLIVANGLYSVSVVLLTGCLREQPGVKAPAVALGYAVFGFGMLLASAGFADSPRLAELATGPTIGLFCVWTMVVARSLERPGRPFRKRGGSDGGQAV